MTEPQQGLNLTINVTWTTDTKTIYMTCLDKWKTSNDLQRK